MPPAKSRKSTSSPKTPGSTGPIRRGQMDPMAAGNMGMNEYGMMPDSMPSGMMPDEQAAMMGMNPYGGGMYGSMEGGAMNNMEYLALARMQGGMPMPGGYGNPAMMMSQRQMLGAQGMMGGMGPYPGMPGQYGMPGGGFYPPMGMDGRGRFPNQPVHHQHNPIPPTPQTGTGRYKREAWDIMFERLLEYKSRHGDCIVPQDYKEIPKLGNWVQKQRTLKKSGILSEDRVQRLDAVGFVWTMQESWDTMYQRLVRYKLKHGDCSVPKHYAEDPKLGRWVRVQRMRRKILTEDRTKRLKQIGFE